MPAPNGSEYIQQALRMLESDGELTSPELAEACGIPLEHAAQVLRRMRLSTPRCPKRVYIARWISGRIGEARPYLRPVYMRGDKSDAKKPKVDMKKFNKEKWARHKARVRQAAPSIFALGAQIGDHHARDLAKSRKSRENKRAKAMQAQDLEAA